MAAPTAQDDSPPSTTIMDKNGDVLFELSKDDATKSHLLVSSKVLSLASLVFAAMFTHGFCEGENLSSSSPRLIPLPDDDPAALTLLCKILHFRTVDIPTTLEVAALANLAILCDKYDCADCVRPWSMLWLPQWLPHAGDDGFGKLLFITYALDLPDAFSEVTLAFSKDCGSLPKADAQSTGYDILPIGLTDQLRERQQEIRLGLCRAIETAVSPWLQIACCDHRSVAGKYFQSLYSVGLWPLSETIGKLKVADIKAKIASFTVGSSCRGYGTCRCTSDTNTTAGTNIKATLVKAIDNVLLSGKGLCLDCVKTGDRAERAEECRIPHSTQKL